MHIKVWINLFHNFAFNKPDLLIRKKGEKVKKWGEKHWLPVNNDVYRIRLSSKMPDNRI